VAGARKSTRRSEIETKALATSVVDPDPDPDPARTDNGATALKTPVKSTVKIRNHIVAGSATKKVNRETSSKKKQISVKLLLTTEISPPVGSLVYRHVIAGWHDTYTQRSSTAGEKDYKESDNQELNINDRNVNGDCNDADDDGKNNLSTIHSVINPATNKASIYYQETSSQALEHAIQQATAIQERLYSCKGSSKSSLTTLLSLSIVDAAAWWSDPHESHKRAEVLTKIADLLKQNTDRLADLEVAQIGRPRKEMRFQLSRLHEWFLYYAALLRTGGGDGGGMSAPPFGGRDHVNLVRRVPLGVVAQITPFNHPLLIAVKKLAPALAAGNCVVLKPSEQAPASVVELALLCREAGLPEGVLSVVLGGKTIGEDLVSDPRIRKVDFTGGPLAGAAIGALAGKNIGKMTQELGGKAPMIVFAPKRGFNSDSSKTLWRKRPRRASPLKENSGDCDGDNNIEKNGDGTGAAEMDAYLDPIVNGCAFGAFIASGQTCIAGTRLLVQREIYPLVCEKLTHKIKNVILKEGMGDPFAMTTTFGPMIHKRQMEFVHSIVTSCTTKNAVNNVNNNLELLCGGKRYRGFQGEEAHLNEGNWYEPTLIAFHPGEGDDANSKTITDLHRTSPLFQKELFGPVLGILPFDDEEHAIQLANDSPFSLGCSIWTHDLVQAHFVADRVRAGIVWINDHHKNAPASPWGGLTKDSGVGKENGTEALLDYSQAKSLVIRTTPFDADWFRDPNARYN